MPIGFIGLGSLGMAMARRLRETGVDLVVWNRTREKAEVFGGEVAGSPSELASRSDIIFLNLFDSGAVREVLDGECGLLQGIGDGKIVVDTTTNHFQAVKEFCELCGEHGVHYLEAPVLGSVVPASQGKLTILISGVPSAYEAAKPYLERLGEKLFYLEQPALATRMKLINNLVLGSLMASLAEAVVLGEECGLSREQVLDVLGAGAGNSGVLAAKRGKLLAEDFSPHFAVRAIYKDLHLMQELAKSMKRRAVAAGPAKELYGLAEERGMAGDDFSAVYKVLREM